jgi:hypothetical protein
MAKSQIRQIRILFVAMLLVATITVLVLPASNMRAESTQSTPKVGDEYEITKRYETSQKTSDGSSGSSRGQDGVLERVIAVRGGGLELEYEFPKDAKAENRTRQWQFPVRSRHVVAVECAPLFHPTRRFVLAHAFNRHFGLDPGSRRLRFRAARGRWNPVH